MKKFSLELPKYRLQMHMHLVKRRKPLVAEPIIPSIKIIKQKYRKGTLISRFFRHVIEHKNVKKMLNTGFAVVFVGTTLLPQSSIQAQEEVTAEAVIHTQTTLTTEKSIQQPLTNYKVNQNYGFFHPAIDLGASVGEPIYPIKPGKVFFAGYTSDGYGNNVIIDHGNGVHSLYAHLSKIEVKEGDQVNMTTEIGQVGKTGRTTGPHLHLEVRENGKNINPYTILPQ